MRDLAQEICSLQTDWQGDNTPEMQRRGAIIRHDIPRWITTVIPKISSQLGVVGADLISDGRDGTGQKTETPWVRLASQSRSPSAQVGWYLVYLFEAIGRGLYLALAHGSTDFVDGAYKPKSPDEISSFMAWATGHLKTEINNYPEFAEKIQLNARRSPLGAAYESTTLLAKWYDINALPTDTKFAEDLQLFARFLKRLYQADDLGQAPNKSTPEARSVAEAINPLDCKVSGGGQGYNLTAEERRAVENCAMERAQKVLEENGFTVRDVSKTESCDFRATRDGQEIVVEVKGTTATGPKILLTANEVELHQKWFPHNALIVVFAIELNRDVSPPLAQGGKVFAVRPWEIYDSGLKPIAYSYDLNPHKKRSDQLD